MRVSGQRHAPAALCPEERIPDTHYTGGWVGPRAGLDTEDRGKILCPCRGSNLVRPVVQSVVRHYTAWATLAALRLYQLHKTRVHSWEANIHSVIQKIPNFLKPERLLLCLKEPVTEPTMSTPLYLVCLTFVLILSYHVSLGFLSGLSSSFSFYNFYCI
jgi:hypothetical protein